MIDPPGSVNAGGDVNVTDATVFSSGQLDSQGSLNLNPGASLVVDPPGSVNTGGDVNLNDSTAIVQGDLDVGGSINIGPGSGFVMDPTGMVNADDSVQVADDAALIVDGELTTPTTSISDGGGLAGTGVINGNVNNSGVVVPGDPISNSTGTLTINGNYTQNQNGTLQINANSTEDFSKVVVNGDATIGGTLAVVPLNGFKPQFGQQLPSFLQANDVDGEFSNIEMPPGFRGRVEEDDGDLTLTFAPASYTQVAQNQNQANVAAALDGFIPATSGDRLVVSTALDHLSTSEYPDAFDAILPAFYQTVSSIGLSLVNTQSQLIDQRLDAIRLGVDRGFSVQGLGKNVPIYKETDGKSAVDGKSGVDGKKSVVTPTLEDTHWGVWVMGSGIFGRSYSVENLPNYRYSSGQFLVGADHRWNKYFSTGLFAGYQGAYATYPESGRVWMNGATFGVYATFDARNGFYASTIVSGSYSNYSTRRSIEFGLFDLERRGGISIAAASEPSSM